MQELNRAAEIYLIGMMFVCALSFLIHNIMLMALVKKLRKEPGQFAEWAKANGFEFSPLNRYWTCVFDVRDKDGNLNTWTTNELYTLWKKG